MTFTSYGDTMTSTGQYVSDIIGDAITTNSNLYANCTNGDMVSCGTYADNLGSAITTAVLQAQSALVAGGGTPEGLYPFPQGLNVNGLTASLPTVSNQSNGQYVSYISPSSTAYSISSSDAYSSYATALQNSINVFFQLNTLAARAYLLGGHVIGYNTAASQNAILKLEESYLADSQAILTAFKDCYGNTSKCSTKFTIPSTGDATKSISDFSSITSAYQLYSSHTTAGSLGDLLRQNFVALQYDVVYSESSTGLLSSAFSNGAHSYYAVGNTANFGLVYYNAITQNAEFTAASGYILPAAAGVYFIGDPQNSLIYPNSQKLFYNYANSGGNITYATAGTSIGNDKTYDISVNIMYPTSTLYFLLNNDANSTLSFAPGHSLAINYSDSFKVNKVYNPYANANADTTTYYTYDSSNAVNFPSQAVNDLSCATGSNCAWFGGVNFTALSSYTIPSTFSGTNANLPQIMLNADSKIEWNTAYYGSAGGESCYNGVYIPSIYTNYGSTTTFFGQWYPSGQGFLAMGGNPKSLICGQNGSNLFYLGALSESDGSASANGSTRTVTQQVRNIKYIVTPIKNFFGF